MSLCSGLHYVYKLVHYKYHRCTDAQNVFSWSSDNQCPSTRAFCTWSWICLNPLSLLTNHFFVCVCIRGTCNPAVCDTINSYSWNACQLEVGTTLACLLLRFDFKFETSFEFLSSNYTGYVTCFLL